MKVIGVRVANEVYDYYMAIENKKERAELLRGILTKAAGFSYDDKQELFNVKELVMKYLEENIGKFNILEKHSDEINETMTEKALDSILKMMN
ncbi:MAG: hypothetical protein N4A57_02900 [Anaeromicrobium sp.]|jgi:hypothetical protein|uniref:hypothetical protein n=1 Tax=Anaeromicrobium sp. TaxID=1929132 RepID=UPI0025CDD2DC|nr:hypothetical protein [Anaeromicrobium sp.]MCT4593210.1 hypothetical protein [Anaeromicrobium sp.]